VKARLSRSGNDVVVRGKVTADLRTPCARCLEPAKVAVDADLSLLLRPAPAGAHAGHAHGKGAANGEKKGEPREDEYEFTSEEAEIDTYDGETVVLDPFVREAILLEVPNFPLCSEDCPGIRPAAAAPAEEEAAPRVDPRFAPLGALRDKLQAAKRPSKPPPPENKTATVRERTPAAKAAGPKARSAAKAAGKKTKKDKE
jgi:uncharacterized protein